MAYIYQIVNNINQKIYIGKTEFSIEKRFKEHCYDAFKRKNEKRPLYSAMRKYGIENFHIELIEETDNPEEREIYWINYYNSFKNGYNATFGGDGKKLIDYDLVIATYNEVKNINKVSNILNIDDHQISLILKEKNVPVLSSSQVIKNQFGVQVGAFDKENNLIKSFSSYNEAGKWLIDTNQTNCKLGTIRTHISEVCRGKRKSASGYIWKSL